MFTEKYVSDHMKQFDLLATSSNEVYRFTYENENYILKRNRLSMDALSPFWYTMYKVFDNSFELQRKNIKELLEFLKKNPSIEVAEIVSTSDKYQYQLYKEAEGLKYEPDEFPDNANIEYQLGLYVGYLHSITFNDYGIFPTPTHEGQYFKKEMLQCMQSLIGTYWKEDKNVLECFSRIQECRIAPTTFSLIMPDISANQFVFSQDCSKINAVVDFDAYVIGPREWELSIIELCLSNRSAFKDGYEAYCKMPDLSELRDFYRFFSYLCDPWEKKDLQSFLKSNVIF